MAWEKHCWAEVDLDALLHNFRQIQARTGSPVCAVVKADAYGHGAVTVAATLERAGAAAFAVSCLAEGRELRRAGIRRPILILGYTDPAFAGELAALDLTQTLLEEDYAKRLSHRVVAAGCTVSCHLKADTGMGRIGFALRADFAGALRRMEDCYTLPGLRITGIFQHFAVADSAAPDDEAYTESQYALFRRAVEVLRADVRPGDEVTVFGPGAAPGADTTRTVADKTGTIPYEVVCDLTRRVPRVYRQHGLTVSVRDCLA